MLHPTTQKLINRLAEMTSARKIDWTIRPNGDLVYSASFYSIVLTASTKGLVIYDDEGKELEHITANQLIATSASEAVTYADLIESIRAGALRYARGTETAISTLLEELGSESQKPEAFSEQTASTRAASEELPSVGVKASLVDDRKPDFSQDFDHEIPFRVYGGTTETEALDEASAGDPDLDQAPFRLDEMRWIQSPRRAKQFNDDKEEKRSVFSAREEQSGSQPDFVECSIFCPPGARRTRLLQVQVFLNLPNSDHRHSVEVTANKIDKRAALRRRKALETKLYHGQFIDLALSSTDPTTRKGFGLDTLSSESIQWLGEPTSVSFFCRLADDTPLGDHLLTCRVALDGAPIGEIGFAIEVRPADSERRHEAELVADTEPKPFNSVFLSYAREDKDEVDKFSRVYGSLGIKVHRDIDTLQPGDNYQIRLVDMIRSSDAFVLLWSTAAQSSEAVREEVNEALAAEKRSLRPKFIPFPIEGPPVPRPWVEFADRHIGDPIYHRS